VFLFNGGGEVDCNNLDQAFAKLDSGEVDIVINRVTTENAPDSVQLTSAVIADPQVLVVNGTAPSFDSLKEKKFTAGKNSICDQSVKTLIKNYFFN
jgi:ABC-type amino acid transport substrate-binding protein